MTTSHLAILFIAFTGCARQATPQATAPMPAAAPVQTHHTGAFEGAPVRNPQLPAASGAEPREVRTIVDEHALKLVAIALRGGTALPPHHSEVPVTIHALHGAGTVIAGSERLRLDSAHSVVLAAGVEHAVEPDGKTDLLLIVHHLGDGREKH